MLVTKYLALAAASLLSITVTDAQTPVPGGWSTKTVDVAAFGRLTNVLSDDAKYPSNTKIRLCLTSVPPTYQERIATGVIEKYDITGCVVTSGSKDGGRCSESIAATCNQAFWQVTLNYMAGSSLVGQEIKLVGPTPKPPATSPPRTYSPGDFVPVEPTEATIGFLRTALAEDANYDAQVTTRICYTAISWLEQQVVSGMNYRYHVSGCAVASGKVGGGACASNIQCTPAKYEVFVNRPRPEQLRVLSIEKDTAVPPSPTPTTSNPMPSACL